MQDSAAQPQNPFPGTIPQDDVQSSTPPISPIANIPTNPTSDTGGSSTPPEPAISSTPVTSGDNDSGVGPKPKRKVSGKVLATIFGLVLLVGGIGAGLLLVQQRQVINQNAQSSGYISGGGDSPVCVTAGTYQLQVCHCNSNTSTSYPGCICSENCTSQTVTPTQDTCYNAGSYALSCGSTQVDIAGQGMCVGTGTAGTCGGGGTNPPPLSCTATFQGISPNQTFKPGQTGTFQVKISNDRAGQGSTGSFVKLNISSSNTSVATVTPSEIQVNDDSALTKTYDLTGTAVATGTATFKVTVDMKPCPACQTTSNICDVSLPINVGTVSTNSPSPTATATAGTAPQCTGIKIYDANFNEIPASDYSKLSPGTQIKIAVTGTTPAGSFDKARFFVNDPVNPIGESPSTVPSNPAEYYIDYTVPSGVTSFTISGELHIAGSNPDIWI